MRDQFSGRGKFQPLDNDRYPGINWTSVRELLDSRRTHQRSRPGESHSHSGATH